MTQLFDKCTMDFYTPWALAVIDPAKIIHIVNKSLTAQGWCLPWFVLIAALINLASTLCVQYKPHGHKAHLIIIVLSKQT